MRLILVAGMHRSGTSFVTELVHEMGATAGSRLLEAAPDNPYGFFEHLDVKRINDELLSRFGGTWDAPPTGLTPNWASSQGLDRLRREAEDLVSTLLQEAEGSELAVIKDPRLSLTAPFWCSVVSADASLVPLRDPLEVMESLRHRNGMSPIRAATLWTRYTVDALLGMDSPHIVPLSTLMSGSADAVASLARLVGLDDGWQGAQKVASERERTWTPDAAFTIRHDDPAVDLACALFAVLSADLDLHVVRPLLHRIAATWGPTPFLDVEDLIGESFDEPVLGAVRTAARRSSELRSELQSERVVSAELKLERDAARRDLRVAKEKFAIDEASALERERTADRAREAMATELATAERRVIELDSRSTDLESRLDAVSRQRDEWKERVDSLVEAHRFDRENHKQQTAGEIATLRQDLERTKAELAKQALRARASERQFQRLNSRRGVRLALRMAGGLRPVVKVVRSARTPRAPRKSQISRGAPSDSEGAPVAIAPRQRSASPALPRDWTAIISRLMHAPPVTIIVPVYNAAADVQCCLDELVRWTPARHDILVIDDASTDERIESVLRRAATAPNLRVLRNETNLGFTRTVNRGFDLAPDDVVILNADARVGPNWLTNLRLAAYSGDRVASASAVSDNAGAFSLPEPGPNDSPGLDEHSLARLYSSRTKRRWVNSPTGHGFCMYIRSDARRETGAFDVESFPRGYGEENDWSMRAIAAGWTHVVDESTMVFHTNAASFSAEAKAELVASARTQLDRLHPTYTGRVQEFVESAMPPVREDAREIVATAREMVEHGGSPVRPRLLSVVQDGRGGTPKTNLDLMKALQSDWDPWILTSDGRKLRLFHVVDDSPSLVEEIVLDQTAGSNRETDPTYREFVARILSSMGFEMVHVRHLFKHTQNDVPQIVRALGLPAVLSFHDFYWVCPNVHLLDEHGRYCGGTCTASPGDCDHPVQGEPLATTLKHDWVYDWRDFNRTRFDSFDQFVTTSAVARDVIQEHFPELVANTINVIPHGRDIESVPPVAVPPGDGPVRIAVIGNLSAAKGGDFLRQLLDLDIGHRLDVHVLGNCDPEFADLRCTFHGPYQRDELAAKLAPIRPSFAGLLSVWPETWSHTLTEAWSVGVPVLVTHLGGALVERVNDHGGGWVLDSDDPASSLREILAVADDADTWRRQADRASIDHLTSTDEMADAYRAVYERARVRRETDPPVVDVRVVTDGDGRSPGSAHIRTLRRFEHPSIREHLASTGDARRHPGSKRGAPDVVWVQRNALAVESIEAVLLDRERRGTSLIVDLDDDLLHPEGLPRQFATYVEHMRHLVASADLVTVSTPPLAEVVKAWNSRVEVLPNQIDETIWWPGDSIPPKKANNGTVDVLYMGTMTHGGDLEVLRTPFSDFTRNEHVDLRLHVVGGAPPASDEWFHRIVVPNDSKEYPAFVEWLRTIAPRFDFAVAPLEDTAFNTSKSDLKFLEYSALGLPGIFSDCPAYRHTVRHGVDGHLAGSASDDWYAALSELMDAEYRDMLRDNALSAVRARTLGATAKDFLELLSTMTRRSDAPTPS